MSYEATAAAWLYARTRPDLDAYTVLVLLALADRHNVVTGQCNPSVRRLALDCHCSEGKVKLALRALEAIGAIGCRIGGGAPGNTNRYVLHIHSPVTVEPGHTVTGSHGNREGVTTRRGGGHGMTANQKRTSNEPAAAAEFDPDCPDCAGTGFRFVEGTHDTTRCDCHAVMVARQDADVIEMRRRAQ